MIGHPPTSGEKSISFVGARSNRPSRLNHRLLERLRNLHGGILQPAGDKEVALLLFRITTRSNHRLASPNVLLRRFNAATDIDRIWTGDITNVSTQEGWLYGAVILDLFSRKVVGLALGRELSKGSSAMRCEAR